MPKFHHHVRNAIKGLHLYSFGALRKLYDWTLSWAHTPYGVFALFLLAFIESSLFIIPSDVLLATMCVSKPKKAFYFAFITTIGSVLGGMFGYLLGITVYDLVGSWLINFFGYQAIFASIGALYHENAFFAILAAAITPIPYKMFTIAAGFWEISFWTLVLASLLGRGFRYFSLATLIFLFGRKIKELIDKYFNIIVSLVFIVIILIVFIVKRAI